MVLTKADAERYFENSERIDLLRGRIENLLKRIKNELEGEFKSLKPQEFGSFPVPGTEYTLEFLSTQLRPGEFCTNIIRLVSSNPGAMMYVYGHEGSIPLKLIGPVYEILHGVMTHFCRFSFGFEVRTTRIIESDL